MPSMTTAQLEDRIAHMPFGSYDVAWYAGGELAGVDPSMPLAYVALCARELRPELGIVAVCRSQDHVEPLVVGRVPSDDA